MAWETFMEYYTLRFGPPLQNNPLGELINLKQTDSVEECQRQFQRLLAQASTIHRDQQVNVFTVGLIDSLCLEVEMQSPTTLMHTMSMIRIFERKQQLQVMTEHNYSDLSQLLIKCNNSVQKTLVSQGNNVTTQSDNTSSPIIKKKTRVEMVEMRLKGLCYNCDEPFVSNCQCKKVILA